MTTSATLGRYEILRELGRGAMGRVFLAHDPQIDRKVAIKTVQYLSALPAHEQLQARERFLREARAVGRLAHPCIVTLYDVDELEGVLYLVMEYVEGATLDTCCQADNLLPAPVVATLVGHSAEALDYAHRAGVVHRDVKPANLIRVGASSLKITDFGLAKQAEAQLTNDGMLLGTPSYMSPEQIRGLPSDGRSDLFSLGVVLFELLTGERPFPGDSVSSIIYRIVHEEPRELVCREPVPAELCAFIERALAKDPAERFATGEEFSRELRQAAAGLVPDSRVQPAAQEASSRRAERQAPARPSRPVESAAAVPPRPLPAAASGGPSRFGLIWIATGILVLAATLGAAGYALREPLGLAAQAKPLEVEWETRVRSEPPGIELMLDGKTVGQGALRFSSSGPFGLLSARYACRTAEHRLDPADAGAEVVLVLDPTELAATVDPGIAAELSFNREPAGSTPSALTMDLCQDNRLELRASGYRPKIVDIPAGSTPLAARKLLAGIDLEPLPKGTLVLPEIKAGVAMYLDGKRLGAGAREVQLEEGTHELRLRNDDHWIDVHGTVEVVSGQTVRAGIEPPALAALAVQAFPANCQVYLRRPGGEWKYLDDTPAERRVAAGRYEVRVDSIPTGESRLRKVDLAPGVNPPIRVSFPEP